SDHRHGQAGTTRPAPARRRELAGTTRVAHCVRAGETPNTSRLEGESMPPLSPPDSQTVDRIVDHLQKCRSILFVTGAGMSAESGLPTYRGVGGLYNSGETTEGFAIEELLSGE